MEASLFCDWSCCVESACGITSASAQKTQSKSEGNPRKVASVAVEAMLWAAGTHCGFQLGEDGTYNAPAVEFLADTYTEFFLGYICSGQFLYSFLPSGRITS